MHPSPPPGPAESYRNSIAAEALLARLDEAEDVAELWESETIAGMRTRLAALYRQFTGVEPPQREALRAGLATIRETGAVPVAEIIRGLPHSKREPGPSPAD